METAFWTGVILLFLTFVGYPAVLLLLSAVRSRLTRDGRICPSSSGLPVVSVIIPVHNEESVIVRRIENLLDLAYPAGCLQIIVASDGCTDSTVEVTIREFGETVLVLDFPVRRGRSLVINDAVKYARGDFVVFTDADTVFAPDFLSKVMQRFEPQVGAVVGRLVYCSRAGSSVSASEGLYWKYETLLRKLESELGILAVGTGAALVARRGLFRPLPPNYDVDDALPLDCIKQGYTVILAPEAIAYDEPPATPRAEVLARVRITSRALAGLLRKWGVREAIAHPGVTLALLFHRLLRYFSPYLMLLVLSTNVFLVPKGEMYTFMGLAQLSFYLLALLGYATHAAGKRLPVASAAVGFCLASIGIAAGVVVALLGRAPSFYSGLNKAAQCSRPPSGRRSH